MRSQHASTPMRFFDHPVPRVALLSACCVLMAGCQSFTTASSTARLRVIDLSADAGALDVYQGTHGIAFNLTYGTVTSYIALSSGTLSAVVDSAGSKQTLSSIETTLLPGTQYTLLVDGSLASLRQTLLTDQPPATGPAIRFVHQAERTGTVDIYLVPVGRRLASLTPVVTNLAPGSITGYLTAPQGVCAAIVLPTGTRPSVGALALHIGRQTEYLQGSARTLILLDASSKLTSGLDVVETTDAEPES